MRSLRLARIAAEAEGVRLRHRTRRAVVRGMLMLVALGFLLGTAVFCHIAAWFWLRQYWQEPGSALILAGVDLVLAAFLALLAVRSSPGQVEIEALAVRQRAVDSITNTLALSALVTQVLRIAADFFRRQRS